MIRLAILITISSFSASALHLTEQIQAPHTDVSYYKTEFSICNPKTMCVQPPQGFDEIQCSDHSPHGRKLIKLLRIFQSKPDFEQLPYGYELAIAPFFSISHNCITDFFQSIGLHLPLACEQINSLRYHNSKETIQEPHEFIEKLGFIIADICSIYHAYHELNSFKGYTFLALGYLGITNSKIKYDELLNRYTRLSEALASHLKISSDEATKIIVRILKDEIPLLPLIHELAIKAQSRQAPVSLSSENAGKSDLASKRVITKPSYEKIVRELFSQLACEITNAAQNNRNPVYTNLIQIEHHLSPDDHIIAIFIPSKTDKAAPRIMQIAGPNLSAAQTEALEVVSAHLQEFSRKEPLKLIFLIKPSKKIWLISVQYDDAQKDIEQWKQHIAEQDYLNENFKDQKRVSRKTLELIALAHEYNKGTHLPKNYLRSRVLAEEAEKQSDNRQAQAQAWLILAELHLNGLSSTLDYEKALSYLTKAASQAHCNATAAYAKVLLAQCFLHGKGYPRNYTRAFDDLTSLAGDSSASLAQAHALLLLGDIYLWGKGIERNETMALRLYEESLELQSKGAPEENRWELIKSDRYSHSIRLKKIRGERLEGWERLAGQQHVPALRARGEYVIGSEHLKKMGNGYSGVPVFQLMVKPGVELHNVWDNAREAIAHFQFSSTDNDEEIQARSWLKLGMVHKLKWEIKNAKDAFLEVIQREHNPNVHAKGLIALAEIYLFPKERNLGEKVEAAYDLAIPLLKKASSQTSCLKSQARAWLYRGELALFGFGVPQNLRKAEKYLLKALKSPYLKSRARAFYRLGKIYTLLDEDFSRARLAFKKAMDDNSKFDFNIFAATRFCCLEFAQWPTDRQSSFMKVMPILDLCRTEDGVRSVILENHTFHP